MTTDRAFTRCLIVLLLAFAAVGAVHAEDTIGPEDNSAPVIDPIANQIIDEEETLVFSIVAYDDNATQTLTYSGINLPDGAEVNATSGEFNWTPGIGQAGVYENVRMRVTDGFEYNATNLTITVQNSTASKTYVPVGSVTIKPETFNLASMGRLTAFITIGSQLFSGNFDIGSLLLGGAEPVKVKFSHKDGGTIIAKYDRQDVAGAARESNGNLTLNGTITIDGEETEFDSSDNVAIIDKEKNNEKNKEKNNNGNGNGKGNKE